MGRPTLFLVLSCLMAYLFNRPFLPGITSWAFLLTASYATLLGLPAWHAAISLGPVLIIILAIRHHIFSHILSAGLALAFYLALDLFILQPILGGIYPERAYTIGVIFGNMMISTLFSLKLKTGKMRQSLAPTG